MISEVFCTQDRDRTGTPKNWCLRPARLPIPPPGLDVEFKRDVCFKLVCKYRNFFQCSKAFLNNFFKKEVPNHRRQGGFRPEAPYLQYHAILNDD